MFQEAPLADDNWPALCEVTEVCGVGICGLEIIALLVNKRFATTFVNHEMLSNIEFTEVILN